MNTFSKQKRQQKSTLLSFIFISGGMILYLSISTVLDWQHKSSNNNVFHQSMIDTNQRNSRVVQDTRVLADQSIDTATTTTPIEEEHAVAGVPDDDENLTTLKNEAVADRTAYNATIETSDVQEQEQKVVLFHNDTNTNRQSRQVFFFHVGKVSCCCFRCSRSSNYPKKLIIRSHSLLIFIDRWRYCRSCIESTLLQKDSKNKMSK